MGCIEELISLPSKMFLQAGQTLVWTLVGTQDLEGSSLHGGVGGVFTGFLKPEILKCSTESWTLQIGRGG